jgi:hypothetical protein
VWIFHKGFIELFVVIFDVCLILSPFLLFPPISYKWHIIILLDCVVGALEKILTSSRTATNVHFWFLSSSWKYLGRSETRNARLVFYKVKTSGFMDIVWWQHCACEYVEKQLIIHYVGEKIPFPIRVAE